MSSLLKMVRAALSDTAKLAEDARQKQFDLRFRSALKQPDPIERERLLSMLEHDMTLE